MMKDFLKDLFFGILIFSIMGFSQVTYVFAQDRSCASYEMMKSNGLFENNPTLAAQFEHCADNVAGKSSEKNDQMDKADNVAGKSPEKNDNMAKVKKLCFEVIDRRILEDPEPWELWDAIVASGMYPEEQIKGIECPRGCDPQAWTFLGRITSSVNTLINSMLPFEWLGGWKDLSRLSRADVELITEKCELWGKMYFPGQ